MDAMGEDDEDSIDGDVSRSIGCWQRACLGQVGLMTGGANLDEW